MRRKKREVASGKSRVRALVDERLDQDSNGAYEASQLLRSQAQRAVKAGHTAKAVETAVEGALALLQRGYVDSGTELALQLVEVLEQVQATASPLTYEEATSALLSVHAAYPPYSTHGPGGAAEGDAGTPPGPTAEQLRFQKACLKWSCAVEEEGAYLLGDPRFHSYLAKTAWARQDLHAAIRHQVLAEEPREVSAAIYGRGASRKDIDAMVLRTVCQFLAVQNLRDGIIFLDSCKLKAEANGSKLSATMEFCSLLVETCQYDAADLYQELLGRFEPLLERDPAVSTCLRSIGEKYFNIQPPPNMMNTIMKMFAPENE